MDGLTRCDQSGVPPLVATAPGRYSCAQREFGQWLRLRCELRGAGAGAMMMISPALKE